MHPDLARSLGRLAYVLESQGRIAEATPFRDRARIIETTRPRIPYHIL
jgi:hypothetical protein